MSKPVTVQLDQAVSCSIQDFKEYVRHPLTDLKEDLQDLEYAAGISRLTEERLAVRFFFEEFLQNPAEIAVSAELHDDNCVVFRLSCVDELDEMRGASGKSLKLNAASL